MDMFGTDTHTDAELVTSIQAASARATVAKRLFEVTGPTVMRLWSWAGPRNAKMRQAIMYAMTGRKLPQSKCGVTACVDTLVDGFGAGGTCAADREDRAVWALWDEWERAGLVDVHKPRQWAAELEALRIEREAA